MTTWADQFNPFRQERVQHSERSAQEAKAFRDLTERALNMLWLACPEARTLEPMYRNPIAQWIVDAQKTLGDADGPV